MNIRVTSTGKIFYRVDPTLAGLLCEALPSVFEPANIAPNTLGVQGDAALARVTAPMETTFGIWTSPTGTPAIQGKNFRTVMYFDGDPNSAQLFTVGGKTPPLEVIEAYRRIYNAGDVHARAEGESEKRRREADDIYVQGGAIRPVTE